MYFVFVADNMKEIVDHYFIKLDVRIYLLLLLIPMILLNFLKNLKFLVPVSLCAWTLSVAGEQLFHKNTVKIVEIQKYKFFLI